MLLLCLYIFFYDIFTADFNPERTHLDIYRILQTELTFDKKIVDEKKFGGFIWKGTLTLFFK